VCGSSCALLHSSHYGTEDDSLHDDVAVLPQRCVCCSVSQCVAVVLQCVAVSCSMLQCVAMCCSVLQCVAVCCRRDVYACISLCKNAEVCMFLCRSVGV